jgi:hypothetical protein
MLFSENNTQHNRGKEFCLIFAYLARHCADKRIAGVFMCQKNNMNIKHRGVNFFCVLWANAPDLGSEARLTFMHKYTL